jgi:outer membrane lipoprotein LolB
MLPWSSDSDSEILTFLPAEQLTQWDMTAKFSVTTAEGSESGAVRWVNSGTGDRLDILSPTGAVVARLSITESEASLVTDDGERRAANADALVAEVLKFKLPVNALKYWVRGLDAPNLALQAVNKDGDGRITDLAQAGWQLTYSGTIAIESGANRYEVPRRLTATQGDLEIRWASTEWQTQIQ